MPGTRPGPDQEQRFERFGAHNSQRFSSWVRPASATIGNLRSTPMARPVLPLGARTTIAPPPALFLAIAIAYAALVTLGAVDVLERSYNGFRTGANTAETTLTPANVRSSANQFHRRFVMNVDGKIE